MNKRLDVYLIAGARPNFMKVAPIIRAMATYPDTFNCSLVHTGQHYDNAMSQVFFDELGIPEPAYHLEAGGGSHAEQTAKIMVAFEKVCQKKPADLIIVVGDVNSTLACAIVAKKLGIPVAHVEAGLRSGDMSMPEEINRRVTDSISDLFFVTEPSAIENLRREGHSESVIEFVGHVMIDNLMYQLSQLHNVDPHSFETNEFKSNNQDYGVLTLHRPSNVDDEEALKRVVDTIKGVASLVPLIFPVHPRTRGAIERYGVSLPENVRLVEPLPYMEFLNLWKDAAFVLTDSGGLQEETTALGVPCFTLRNNTERPVTVSEGSNTIVGTDPKRITEAVQTLLSGSRLRVERRPRKWDGKSAERIVDVIKARFFDDFDLPRL